MTIFVGPNFLVQKALRRGDTLLIWKLDRLGRDLRHLINTVHDLTARGIGLKVLSGQSAAIDTTMAAGKFWHFCSFGRIWARTDSRTYQSWLSWDQWQTDGRAFWQEMDTLEETPDGLGKIV